MGKRSSTRTEHSKLFDAALEVAMRNSCSYSGFETREKACKALKRRCKGFADEVYLDALEEGIQCWHSVEEEVQKCVEQFRGRRPQFTSGAICQSIGWASYWLAR